MIFNKLRLLPESAHFMKMLKENLEKEITDQQKIGRIHKLTIIPLSSSASESPSENDFLENSSGGSCDRGRVNNSSSPMV